MESGAERRATGENDESSQGARPERPCIVKSITMTRQRRLHKWYPTDGVSTSTSSSHLRMAHCSASTSAIVSSAVL